RALLSRAAPSAQQAEPDGIACSSCGLTMQQSRMLAEQPAEEARGVDVVTHAKIVANCLMAAKQILGDHWNGACDDALTHADTLVALLAAPAAGTGHGKPFGWASASNGNYFTRSERIAKRIGGLVPVYTAPQAATGAQGLIALLREARGVVERQWDESNTAADHDLLQRIDAALAASKEGA
ncbi:hypothetical protein, partial [Cupriavidus gilardii]